MNAPISKATFKYDISVRRLIILLKASPRQNLMILPLHRSSKIMNRL